MAHSITETIGKIDNSLSSLHEKVDGVLVMCTNLQNIVSSFQSPRGSPQSTAPSLRVIPSSPATAPNTPLQRVSHVVADSDSEETSGAAAGRRGSRKRGRDANEEGSHGAATTARAFHYYPETIVLELEPEKDLPKYCLLVGWGVWMYAQRIPQEGGKVCGPLFSFRLRSVKTPNGLTSRNRDKTLSLNGLPDDIRELQRLFPDASSWVRYPEQRVRNELSAHSRRHSAPRTPPTTAKKQQQLASTTSAEPHQVQGKLHPAGPQQVNGGGANPSSPIVI